MIPKSKIRRRRKKIPVDLPSLSDPQRLADTPHSESTDRIRSHRAEHKLKLNEIYVRDEQEVKTALTYRMKNADTATPRADHSPSESQKLQCELDFFTDALRENDENVMDDKTDASHQTDGDEKAPSEATTAGDGQLMASSFVLIDDDPVVQVWRRAVNDKADAELFITNANTVKQNVDEVEGPESLIEARDEENDGLFVHQRPPRLSEADEDFLIQRLLLTGHTDCVRINKGRRQLIGLQSSGNDSASRLLYRSVSSKEFIPIRYEPRHEPNVSQHATSVVDDTSELHMTLESIEWDINHEANQEQKLTRIIQDLYRDYQRYNQVNTIGRLEQKLQSIRDLLLKFELNPCDRDITQFICDRRDLRNKIHREHTTMRNNVLTLLDKWVQLKELRQAQGFTSTCLKMVIRTTDTDLVEDQKRWDLDFNAELNEVLEEAIQFYKQGKQARVKPKDGEGDVPDEFESKKPNPEEIEEMLHDIFVRSRRHPGEPIVRLEIEQLQLGADGRKPSSVTQNFYIRLSIGKQKKEFMRKAMSVDKKVILSVDVKMLVPYSEHHQPNGWHILISKEKPSSHFKVVLPLPHAHEIYKSAQTNAINFATSSNMSGKLNIKQGWTQQLCQGKCSDSKSRASTTQPPPLLEPGVMSILKTWYDECTIDPMDPDAAFTVNAIASQPGGHSITDSSSPNQSHRAKHGQFRLNEDLTAFCSKETILTDKRLNLLTARFNSHLQLKDEKYVPPNSREMPPDSVDPDLDPIIQDLHWMDPIDVQRHEGNKRLLHIYRAILNHCEVLNKHFDSQDLLIGDEVPTFSSFLATVRQLFVTRRPLNPQRCRSVVLPSMRTVSFVGHHPTSFKLIVNVIRAQGVPFRNAEPNGDGASRRLSAGKSGFAHRTPLVMPYVVVAFRDKTCRTSTAEGPNPTWNEQLVISMSGITNVDTIKDSLEIQLFDEQIENLLDEDRMRANEIYQRISSRWLADIRIPFFTILASQRLEGTFEMSTPPLVLGYSKPDISMPSDVSHGSGNTFPEARNSVHLTLFIHLEPVFTANSLNTVHLDCSELPVVVNRVDTWLAEFRDEFPHRSLNPLVALSNGKRVCVTRLVGAIDVPCERSNVSEFLVRRFVGLLPIVRNGGECTRLGGVWLTIEQTLSMLSASAKDIGTILVGFYLSLGFRAYLVLGFALPHGDTTFVLTKENGEYFLVDPTTGRKYLANDAMCPLTRVYAIVSSDNVWANIQRENRVYMMHFNVAQSSEWRALFGRACAAPVGLVHNADMIYAPSDEVFDLRKIIEWKVMKKISAWRPHRKTRWNRHINETLRQVLVELEEDVCYEYEPAATTDSCVRKLHELTDVYHVSGLPLNMRYISMADMVKRLKTIGVHLNPDGRVEFGLAVHIQPYPCNVLSLWVFVVALVPKA